MDTPGQVGHESRRRKEIVGALKTGVLGIVNVVSYGYHEYNTEPSRAVKSSQADEGFLKAHREIELKALEDWKGLLGDRGVAKWLMTVVTKADLWWDRKEEVLAYYEDGAYREALGPANDLGPVVMPYCSVFHKFYKLSPMSGAFDEEDRRMAQGHLLKEMIASVGKESRG